MVSAANLNAVEDAGFSFIVGSRMAKAALCEPGRALRTPWDYFADGQILESTRVMGVGSAARSRRIVYQYRFARRKRDERAINAMVDKAEKVAAGSRPLKRDRFVTVRGADKAVDWARVERARQLAGLKGYVTNIPTSTMAGAAVIGAYHDLFDVERSFRMAKTDLRARPIFHRTKDSIEAHLTVVFAALAISRHLQAATGVSIKKTVRTLRPLRTVQIRLAGQTITATPMITPEARAILDQLPPTTAPGQGTRTVQVRSDRRAVAGPRGDLAGRLDKLAEVSNGAGQTPAAPTRSRVVLARSRVQVLGARPGPRIGRIGS